MAGFESTYFIGNVGRVDAIRYTQAGRAVISWSLAVSRKWTDKQTGQQQERTKWVRCTAWGALAETVSQFVTVGMQMHVAGDIDASAWVADDGEARASLELTVRDMTFLGSRADANANADGREEQEPLPF